MSIFVERTHPPGRAGHHRSRRVVPRAADARVRHQGRGRRDAGEGRPDLRGQGPGLQHRGRRGPRDRRQHLGHLRAADGRGRRGDRGRRCRSSADRVHHRGDSGHGHEPGDAVRAEPGRAPARSQLSGAHHARDQDQGRHHSRKHLQRRASRAGLAQRHAHLRSGEPPHAGRDRAEHLRGHRRRSRSSGPTSSTASRRSRTTPRPTRSS